MNVYKLQIYYDLESLYNKHLLYRSLGIACFNVPLTPVKWP